LSKRNNIVAKYILLENLIMMIMKSNSQASHLQTVSQEGNHHLSSEIDKNGDHIELASFDIKRKLALPINFEQDAGGAYEHTTGARKSEHSKLQEKIPPSRSQSDDE
jgi:hypothetical protein